MKLVDTVDKLHLDHAGCVRPMIMGGIYLYQYPTRNTHVQPRNDWAVSARPKNILKFRISSHSPSTTPEVFRSAYSHMLPFASPATQSYSHMLPFASPATQSAQTFNPGQHLCLFCRVPIPKDEWEAAATCKPDRKKQADHFDWLFSTNSVIIHGKRPPSSRDALTMATEKMMQEPAQQQGRLRTCRSCRCPCEGTECRCRTSIAVGPLSEAPPIENDNVGDGTFPKSNELLTDVDELKDILDLLEGTDDRSSQVLLNEGDGTFPPSNAFALSKLDNEAPLDMVEALDMVLIEDTVEELLDAVEPCFIAAAETDFDPEKPPQWDERRATEAREALPGPLPHPMVDALKERVASAEEWAAFVQQAINWDAIEDSRERRPQLRASKAMAYAAIERALRRWGVSPAYCEGLAAGQTASTLFHTVQACADASQSPSALAIMPSPLTPVRGLPIRSQDAPGGSPPMRSHQDAPGGSPALARNSRAGVRQELRIRSGGELPPDIEAVLGGQMRPEAGMRGQMRPALAAKFLLGLAHITWEGRLPAGCLGELCHALVAAWVRITLACCAQRLYIVVEAYDATKAHANLLLFASERDASAAASAAALRVTSTPAPLQRILRLPAEDVELLCDVWAPPEARAGPLPAPHALDRALQLSQEPVLHERAHRTCHHNDRGHLAAEAPMGRRAVKTLPHQRSVTPCSCSAPDWRWKESLGGGSCAGI